MEKRTAPKDVCIKEHTLDDWYYTVLKICIEDNNIAVKEVCEKMQLEIACHHFDILAKFSLIEPIKNEANTMVVTPHGFATYLSISSQKQANEHALKAMKQATKATNYAKWAFWVSIASFLVSIVLSILQLVLK